MRKILVAQCLVAGGLVVLFSCTSDDDASVTSAADAGDVFVPADGSAAPVDGAPMSDGGVDTGVDAKAPLVDTCGDGGTLAGAWVADPHLCLQVFATDLSLARQMAFAPNGDLFVQAAGNVMALFDTNHDGVISTTDEQAAFAHTVDGSTELNHGLAFSADAKWVYASNESTIWRWPYTMGSHAAPIPAEVVVHDIPGTGGHVSRTLVFDAAGHLYVNVGSEGDVDQEAQQLATRAMIRRFTIPDPLPAGGLDYATGEVFASGMRNEVGIAVDPKGRIWSVENGSDSIYRPQFGDLTPDNPGEEINRLDEPGSRFFGYPYCWSERQIDGGMGNGTQWAYYGYPLSQTDSWCRDPANVHPPKFAMQGHWASLGITMYTGNSLPWNGDLLVTSHGSSFRSPPVGRLIARAHLVGDTITSVTPIAGHLVDGGLEEGTWESRPVDIKTGPDGAVYISDDRSHRILRLGYRP